LSCTHSTHFQIRFSSIIQTTPTLRRVARGLRARREPSCPDGRHPLLDLGRRLRQSSSDVSVRPANVATTYVATVFRCPLLAMRQGSRTPSTRTPFSPDTGTTSRRVSVFATTPTARSSSGKGTFLRSSIIECKPRFRSQDRQPHRVGVRLGQHRRRHRRKRGHRERGWFGRVPVVRKLAGCGLSGLRRGVHRAVSNEDEPASTRPRRTRNII
jgi:hypothetical protein